MGALAHDRLREAGRGMKHNRSQIKGHFVPLLLETIDTPAWRTMSHGAKNLYVALRRRYNASTDNNGKIFLSQRAAEQEINSKRLYIARWLRELQHFGFIVMTASGYLGVRGHGRAARWRLTELPSNGLPATRDFATWAGVPFANQKTKPRLPKGSQETAAPWLPKGGQKCGSQKGARSR
jgi:hypothetical protein